MLLASSSSTRITSQQGASTSGRHAEQPQRCRCICPASRSQEAARAATTAAAAGMPCAALLVNFLQRQGVELSSASAAAESPAVSSVEQQAAVSRHWEHKAVLKAVKRSSRQIQEGRRPLGAFELCTRALHVSAAACTDTCFDAAEYMALPASQYSVLDAKKIDRIDERTFRCYVNAIRFLGLTIEPVLTVRVEEGSRGPTVKLLDTRVSTACWATLSGTCPD